MIIDTHAHLSCKQMENVKKEIIDNLSPNSVGLIVCPSYDFETCKSTLELCNQEPKIFGALGIHPSDERTYCLEIEKFIEQNIDNPKIVAVGEIGLDYHYDNPRPKNQAEVMLAQMQIAKKHNVPVIFHIRDAFADFFDILNVNKDLISGGVIHCFLGNKEHAKQALDLGLMISVTGALTYKGNTVTQEAVQYIPLDRLMLETDSPYLSPVPHRGKMCVPLYTELVCEKVAELKNISFDDVANQTTENALKFFTKMGEKWK